MVDFSLYCILVIDLNNHTHVHGWMDVIRIRISNVMVDDTTGNSPIFDCFLYWLFPVVGRTENTVSDIQLHSVERTLQAEMLIEIDLLTVNAEEVDGQLITDNQPLS